MKTKRIAVFLMILISCLTLLNIAQPVKADSSDFVIENGVLKKYTGTDPVVVIPKGVTTIGSYVFRDNTTAITEVKIPSSVTTIRSYAFAGSSKITQLVIPDSVTSIETFAFYGCLSLKSIQLPKNLKAIENSTFAGCKNLTKVVIPSTVTKIGLSAFKGCAALTSISLPAGVTTVPNDAFADCTSLKKVTLSNKTTTIGDGAFGYCPALTEIVLPKTVKTIGVEAFVDCENLKDVYFDGSKAAWKKVVIDDGNESLAAAKIHCNPFTDVTSSNTFYKPIQFMYDNGFMNGTSATTFSPNTTTKRGMMAVILWHMAGNPAVSGTSKFSDTDPNAYYYKAVVWATQNKLITGYADGTFKPNQAITRAQVAVLLWRFANYQGIEIKGKANLGQFTDAADVPASAKEALQWAVANKIVNGKSNGTVLDPKGTATRGEIAAMVYAYCTKLA